MLVVAALPVAELLGAAGTGLLGGAVLGQMHLQWVFLRVLLAAHPALVGLLGRMAVHVHLERVQALAGEVAHFAVVHFVRQMAQAVTLEGGKALEWLWGIWCLFALLYIICPDLEKVCNSFRKQKI